jgi:hypothetical protein
MIEIKHRFTGEVLYTFDGDTLQDADLRDANLRGAYLTGSDLTGADLTGAYLTGAYLTGAKSIIQWQSPQGEKRICYSVKHTDCIMHKLGCFWGNTDEATSAIREKYGDNSMYEQMLKLNAQALEVEQ